MTRLPSSRSRVRSSLGSRSGPEPVEVDDRRDDLELPPAEARGGDPVTAGVDDDAVHAAQGGRKEDPLVGPRGQTARDPGQVEVAVVREADRDAPSDQPARREERGERGRVVEMEDVARLVAERAAGPEIDRSVHDRSEGPGP